MNDNGVNPKTGELLDRYLEKPDAPGEKKIKALPLSKEREFVMMWPHEWRKYKFTANQAEILLHLVERMDARGRVVYTLTELAEAIGVSRTSAWRIVDSMAAKDIIRRRGRSDIYVNPLIMWKGAIAERTAAHMRWINQLDAKRDGRADGGE